MLHQTEFEKAIAVLESQRSVLGDAVTDTLIETLQLRLAHRDISEPDQQRKLVTVLFADLVGWTRVSEKMDPEDVQAIQESFFAAVTPAIEQHGGAVEKYIGDAVLAVFGVPQAHEDDPERAVRAALTMQVAVAFLNNSLATSDYLISDPPTLSLRIGIHTGLVVSSVDSDGDFTVTGDTVNLSSRLESAAPSGSVLISEETHKLVAHAFVTEAVDPIQAKGKSELLTAYRVLSTRDHASKLRGITGLDSPLVGREAECETIQEALNRLQKGLGGIVTVIGEAGIGKSRLVTEVRKSQPTSVLWLEGRCLSFGSTIPYLLWLDVLRSTLRVKLDDSLEIVKYRLQTWVREACPDKFNEVYPYLARLLSLPLEAETLVELAELDGSTLKSRTFKAVETAIGCAARRQPLVVVCEDLHWADPSSIELLRHFLPRVMDAPVLVIIVSRIRNKHHAWQLLDVIRQSFSERHTDLWLRPLSPMESDILVANLLHTETMPPSLRVRILSKAEGNPFFMEEVIRSLIDLGVVRYDKVTATWIVTREASNIPIPDTLRGVLAARIDRLNADTRHVLQLASVIGRIFLYQVLAALAKEERDLEGKLMTLVQEELIRERARIPELEFIFKHALTQEATYHGILKRQRRVFHRQVAQTLERLFPDRTDELLGVLAHHWEQAEEANEAVQYLLRAGDKARLAYTNEAAVGFYERAVHLLEQQNVPERLAPVLMKLGAVFHNAFDFEHSREIYDRAFSVWSLVADSAYPPAPHALRYAVPESVYLDPTRATSSLDVWWHDALFSSLTHLDANGEVVPELAYRWQILDGGRAYVFELRKDAYWSDGQPVTAWDFEYAWKQMLDPISGNKDLALLLYDIRNAEVYFQGDEVDLGIDVQDDYTLVVRLTQPVSYFLHLLGTTFAVPRHLIEVHGESWTDPSHLVTNGPFCIEVCQPGVKTILIRNPDFRGIFRGNLERVELIHLQDISQLPGMFLGNELDTLDLSLPEELKFARGKSDGVYSTRPEYSVYFLGFTLEAPPFDDIRVRKAFGYAIDRNDTWTVKEGIAQPGTGGFVPPGIPGHSPNIGSDYKPDLACWLLDQAGYPRGLGFPPVSFGFGDHRAELGHYLVRQWEQVLGVTVNPQALDKNTFFYGPLTDFPIRLHVWSADFGDPDNFLRLAVSQELPGFNHPTYQRLVRAALRTTDQEERLDLYRQADRILLEQAGAVILSYGVSHSLDKPWLRANRGTRSLRLRDVVIEPH